MRSFGWRKTRICYLLWVKYGCQEDICVFDSEEMNRRQGEDRAESCFWRRRHWCSCWGWENRWRMDCEWDGMRNQNDEIHSNTVGCDPSLKYSMEMKKIKIFICMFLWWKCATWLKYFMKVNRWIEFYAIPQLSSLLHFGRIFPVVLVFVSRLCLSFVYNNSSSSFPFTVSASPPPRSWITPISMLHSMGCCAVLLN